MAFDFQKPYSPDIEQQLRQYYQSLSEKDRRRFAAIEALTLGHGGMRYIAQVLGCDPQTVREGMRELPHLPHRDAPFRHVSHLIQEFLTTGNPVLSIDISGCEFCQFL